jgi:hypothetical protein
LKEASTLKEVEQLRQEPGKHGMDPVEFSTDAFQALVRNEASFDNLIAFLKDPRLNPPEARNMTIFITHLSPPRLKDEQIRSFIATLEQSIVLGSILPGELLDIIEKIDHLAWQTTSKQKQRVKKTRARSHMRLFEAYRAIWNGMLGCRIAPVDSSAIHLLLSKVAVLRGAHGSSGLLLELFQHAWPIEHPVSSGFPTMDQYILSWLDNVHRHEFRKHRQHPGTDAELDKTAFTNMFNVINRFPLSLHWISSAISLLAGQKPAVTSSEYAVWSEKLNMFLTCLCGSGKFQDHFLLKPSNGEQREKRYRLRENWSTIYKQLAPRVSILDLVPHFAHLEAEGICRVLLQCWVPLLYIQSTLDGPKRQESGSRRRQHFGTRQLEKLKQNFDSAMSADLQSRDCLNGDICSFPNLFSTLNSSTLQHRDLMGEVFRFVHHRHGPAALLDLCELLRKKGVPIFSTSVLKVLDDISSTNPTLAYIFYKCHNIWISRCPDLLIALIKEGVHGAEIFRILKDREESNTVPLPERLNAINATSDFRNTLVHMVADTISRYPSRGSRVAFRDVSTCYRYLQDRQAPINPIIGRALVRTGVSQFLHEKRWVSTERFKWILGVVRHLEGDQVADELDTVIFRWRERVKAFNREQARILRQQGMFTGTRVLIAPLETPVDASVNARMHARDRSAWRSRGNFRVWRYGTRVSKQYTIKLYASGGRRVVTPTLHGLPHEEFVHQYLNGGRLTVTGFKGVKRLVLHEKSLPQRFVLRDEDHPKTPQPQQESRRKSIISQQISQTGGQWTRKPSPTFFETTPPIAAKRTKRKTQKRQELARPVGLSTTLDEQRMATLISTPAMQPSIPAADHPVREPILPTAEWHPVSVAVKQQLEPDMSNMIQHPIAVAGANSNSTTISPSVFVFGEQKEEPTILTTIRQNVREPDLPMSESDTSTASRRPTSLPNLLTASASASMKVCYNHRSQLPPQIDLKRYQRHKERLEKWKENKIKEEENEMQRKRRPENNK